MLSREQLSTATAWGLLDTGGFAQVDDTRRRPLMTDVGPELAAMGPPP